MVQYSALSKMENDWSSFSSFSFFLLMALISFFVHCESSEIGLNSLGVLEKKADSKVVARYWKIRRWMGNSNEMTVVVLPLAKCRCYLPRSKGVGHVHLYTEMCISITFHALSHDVILAIIHRKELSFVFTPHVLFKFTTFLKHTYTS